MENKTAIQELMEIVDMDYQNGVQISMKAFYGMLKKALEKERQQIIDAHAKGNAINSFYGVSKSAIKVAEQYFNNKYKQD